MDENFDFVDRFLSFSGKYELHGFGKHDGCELKMGPTLDGLHGQLTPIWKKEHTLTQSKHFIFFNKTRWELHETKSHNGFFTSVTYDHIFCKTGLTNQFSLEILILYKQF